MMSDNSHFISFLAECQEEEGKYIVHVLTAHLEHSPKFNAYSLFLVIFLL